ncbi:hypothetical protein FHR98_002045 [Limibacillus halophilus]|uniref:Uncharacterized protein n=1 Tax=Limibacillus halophilus TaxID=1579333 RepID=A0A839SUQ8_9PROT|nr:hypothetical protein [Limibacillus halophilus]
MTRIIPVTFLAVVLRGVQDPRPSSTRINGKVRWREWLLLILGGRPDRETRMTGR